MLEHSIVPGLVSRGGCRDHRRARGARHRDPQRDSRRRGRVPVGGVQRDNGVLPRGRGRFGAGGDRRDRRRDPAT